MSRASLLFAVAVLAGCARLSPQPGGEALAGRIWDSHARQFITAVEAESRVAAADYALLGETHDNPGHHRIQLRLIERVAKAASPAVAFEQIDREWQGAVDAALASGAGAGAIASAGRVAKSWRWALYEPLAAFALAHRLRIVAANFSRERARAIVAGGIASLGPDEPRRLGLAQTWTAGRNAVQRALLVEGHCGQDDPVIDKLVDVQRVRDAVMADAILESPRTVAIIGRGHARADVGVPLYLASRAPGKRVVSVGLVEVEDGKGDPRDYGDAAPGVHDLVWFTTRATRPDPCAGFKPVAR